MYKMITSFDDFELKTALLKDDVLEEILIQRTFHKDISGNIYKAKVENIINATNSAFLNIGKTKKAFLYIKKNSNLKIGDELIVQVKNDARENKGAKLTEEYTINGKFLIYIPNIKNIAISSKITDINEILRLKTIFKNINFNEGIIIRTAAYGIDEDILLKEFYELKKEADNIREKFKVSKVGEILNKDIDRYRKIEKDFAYLDLEEIVIDNDFLYNALLEYFKETENLKWLKILKKFHKEVDIFDYYGINNEIEKALSKIVYLKSGASIFIEKTEALISIDVNTGSNTKLLNEIDTVYRTNLEAAKEIARQLKIRNLAGVIVIDFIGMDDENKTFQLLKQFREYLKEDRMKTEIVNYSSLGLIEMTRKRVGLELSSFYLEKCSCCSGCSYIKSREIFAIEIAREIKNIFKDKEIKKIEILTNANIIDYFQNNFSKFIDFNKLSFKKDNSLSSYKLYLYK